MPDRDRFSQTPPPTAPTEIAPRPGRRFGRRGFLQIGFLGAAGATLTTACAGSSAAQTPPPTIDPGVTPAQLIPTTESWNEPWVWRPHDWPGQALQMTVVENQAAGPVEGLGNPNGVIFSYGGQTPGPTIRMRGDETLKVRLQNLLGFDGGSTAIGPNPDPKELTPGLAAQVAAYQAAHPEATKTQAVHEVTGNDLRDDYCLGEHTNGLHAARVTNLHTHGLHVRPYKNPDGTHSDNVILRVLPQADFRERERAAPSPECLFLQSDSQTNFLADDEQVGAADYEFRIGDVQAAQMRAEHRPPQPHPPGTHWYHPHCHGATHNQVASGMAGFLIVEGDVDEAINRRMTGRADPDPTLKTGRWDYRERLMLVQRVFLASTDPDAPQQQQKDEQTPTILVNGNLNPPVITMRPGAVERWRMLNGSVDGRGFKRMMALKGLYGLVDAPKPGNGGSVPKLAKWDGQQYRLAPYAQIEADKQDLTLLALDGITLVEQDGEAPPRYVVRDLSTQNAGTANPLAAPVSSNADLLRNYQNVYKSGESIRNTWVRPNEVYFGPANRADVLFQAPPLDGGAQTVTPSGTTTPVTGEIYTVVAKAVVVHADNYQQKLQQNLDQPVLVPGPEDIIVAYLVVKDEPCPPLGATLPEAIQAVLPAVPPYLTPVTNADLQTAPGRQFRTRTVNYSGWGAQDFPLVTTGEGDPSRDAFLAFIAEHPELRDLVYAENGGVDVLMPPAIRTMAIDGRKFDPTDSERPQMELGSSEEWALFNLSTMLWGDTTSTRPGQYGGHLPAAPLSRAAGQRRFAENNTVQIVTKGVDHPFHMHQNPFWVTRIEIPDETGTLHNILDRPRWMDAVWIPRHRGRVVFRSRFPDFVGTYVNHCHILQHEDNGMMTPVEVTPFADKANFVARDGVVSTTTALAEVNRLYPQPSLAEAFAFNSRFVDPNHASGQVYPGFEVSPESSV